MTTFDVSLPELAFVAATRGMAGVGIGLLAAECFSRADHRRAAGWTLLAIGIATTLPIALTALARRRSALHDAARASPLKPLAYAGPIR
jgi:hypothetical protein